jgi:hypothetical protein
LNEIPVEAVASRSRKIFELHYRRSFPVLMKIKGTWDENQKNGGESLGR